MEERGISQKQIIDRQDFLNEQEAFFLAQKFRSLSPGEKTLFFHQNLSKSPSKFLWNDLRISGAFSFTFDEDERDQNTWENIGYLSDRSDILNLPDDFYDYLANILSAKSFYNRIISRRNELDVRIKMQLTTLSYSEYVFGILERINQRRSKETTVYWEEKDIKKKPRYFEAVAAATYLIRRGWTFATKDQTEKEMPNYADIPSLFEDTCLYLYHRQQFFNITYFGNSFSKGIIKSSAVFSQEALETSAGVQMEEMMEQEDRTNRDPDFTDPEDVRRFEDHLIRREAKVFGVPEEDYLDFIFYKELTFRDIRRFQKELARLLSMPSGNGNVLNTKKDLLRFLKRVYRRDDKAKALLELLVSSPEDLIDLYQSPFLEINHQLLWSKGLLLSDNYLRNLASRAMKCDSTKIKTKGALFQTQVVEALEKDGWKVAPSIKISMTVNKHHLGGDIDIAAEKDGQLYLFECKSDTPAQDYFDFRRNDEVVEKGMIEVQKSFLFCDDLNGRMILEEKLGIKLKDCRIVGALLASNCYASCKTNLPFPVFSLYEIKNAINHGILTLDGVSYPPRNENTTMPEFLENKLLAKLLVKSMVGHEIKTSLFMMSASFDDYFLEGYAFEKRLSRYYHYKISLKNRIHHFFIQARYHVDQVISALALIILIVLGLILLIIF